MYFGILLCSFYPHYKGLTQWRLWYPSRTRKWAQVMKRHLCECGRMFFSSDVLNLVGCALLILWIWNAPPRHVLDTWSPVGGIIFRRFGSFKRWVLGGGSRSLGDMPVKRVSAPIATFPLPLDPAALCPLHQDLLRHQNQTMESRIMNSDLWNCQTNGFPYFKWLSPASDILLKSTQKVANRCIVIYLSKVETLKGLYIWWPGLP